MFRLAKAESSGDNATEVEDDDDDNDVVDYDSFDTAEVTKFLKEMVSVDAFSQLMTGGGACRYCVEECPDHT